jgi:DNA polymerase I-like protein with 3'-5' exonuclease and polymerase domains
MGIFLSNFLTAPLDDDGRMRCAYNIGGSAGGKSAPKTYRLSSSENAFGSGTNLQVIPSEKSSSVGKAAARGSTAGLGDAYSYPNVRSIFIPDPGYTLWDGDLDRADLQVVVWESDDPMLKAALRIGADIHLMNAYILNGKEPPPLEELVERHKESEACTCGPRCYWDYRKPMKLKRGFARIFVHGTNYGGQPRTMAAHTGQTVKEVENAQKVWFGAHPGIYKWHERIRIQATTKRYVENRFGYRWYIFERADSIIPEAIAWIPQSTVSVVINKIWLRIYEEIPEAQVLLQCHDSLVGQVPNARAEQLLAKISELAKVIVPYEDPLIIPFGIKTSTKSWGDTK